MSITVPNEPAPNEPAPNEPPPGEPAPSESVRARKKRATREALRQAAVEMVAARGLAAVTVEEIAEAAGVSTRTFFNYFPTKEDAVAGWEPSRVADMAECLRHRPAAEAPMEALRATLVDTLSPGKGDYRELLARLRVMRGDPHLVAHYAQRFGDTERSLVAALAERRGRHPDDDHYASLAVGCVLAAGRAALMAWCAGEGRVPLERVLADHLDVLGAGLAEPRERNGL